MEIRWSKLLYVQGSSNYEQEPLMVLVTMKTDNLFLFPATEQAQ